jgi:hypothetical protein
MHNNNVYTCSSIIPAAFNLELPDTVNVGKNLTLNLGNKHITYVKVVVWNPFSVYSERLVLIDSEFTNINEIQIPFEKYAKKIKGWNGSLSLTRNHSGLCDQRLSESSSIMGISSYYKEFALIVKP